VKALIVPAGLLLLASTNTIADEGAWAATVKRVQGQATATRAGAKHPLTEGQRIQPGDIVQTEPGGSIALTTPEETRIAVGPASRLVIERFAFNSTTNEGTLAIAVLRGMVAFVSGLVAKASPEAMQIRTPNAALGIRGTEFIVEVDGHD
jgi:hypothetical protein